MFSAYISQWPDFSHNGVVKSVRGIHGGYILNRDPAKISLGEIFQVLSEKKVRFNKIKSDLCKQFPGKESECVHLSQCAIRMLWAMIMLKVYGVLNHLPLSFLVGSESEVQARLLEVVSRENAGGLKGEKEMEMVGSQ